MSELTPVPVDIVLPCYNPQETWFQELIQFHNFVGNRYKLRYIIVNDGSDADIRNHITELEKRNISLNYLTYKKNKGKGHALRHGVKCSDAPFIVYTDIDFPFTHQSTCDVIDALVTGKYDVVAGYRDALYYQKKMSGFRKMLSRAFRFFIQKVLKMKISDTQCGLKGFNEKGKQKFLSTRINRYLFDFEFIYLSSKDTTIAIQSLKVYLRENIVFSKMRFKIVVQELFNLLAFLLIRKK